MIHFRGEPSGLNVCDIARHLGYAKERAAMHGMSEMLLLLPRGLIHTHATENKRK